MRQLIRVGTSFLALCMLLAFPFEVQAGCKAPRRGPPGPPGPQGPAGTGTLAANYASAFSIGTQDVTSTVSPYAILFNTNQVPPKGIVHPVANTAQFQVLQAGVYLITWTLSLTINNETEDTAQIILFDVTTNSAINPNPQQNQFVDDNDSQSVSGQTIVSLPANEVIELQLAFDAPMLFQITSPTFTITQIAPAP
jgi:hypothetical protein